MSDTDRRSFVCRECGDEFSRADHLSRHLRSHKADKPFACQLCGKKFNRRDTLVRHERGRHKVLPNNSTAVFSRIPRACTHCHKSKIRCDGDQPCKNCVTKGHDCQRMHRTRRHNGNTSSRVTDNDSTNDNKTDGRIEAGSEGGMHERDDNTDNGRDNDSIVMSPEQDASVSSTTPDGRERDTDIFAALVDNLVSLRPLTSEETLQQLPEGSHTPQTVFAINRSACHDMDWQAGQAGQVGDATMSTINPGTSGTPGTPGNPEYPTHTSSLAESTLLAESTTLPLGPPSRPPENSLLFEPIQHHHEYLPQELLPIELIGKSLEQQPECSLQTANMTNTENASDAANMADTTTEPTGVEPWWQNDRFSALDTPQSSDLGQPTLLASECSSNSGLTDWVPQFNIADWMAWDWDWMNTGLPLNREGWDNMLHDTPGRYDGHAHNAMAIEPMSMPPVSGTITSSTNMAFTEMPMSIEHPHLNGLGPGLPFEQPPPTVQKDRSHSWKRAPTAGAMFFTFSRVSAEDMDILVSENSGHVASLFDEAYRKMAEGVRNACSGNGNGNGNGNDSDSGSGSGSGAHFIPERAEFDSFPSRQVLDAFIQLYFEYFQHLFPLVHQPTFHSARTHWILVLAVASIGCRYSKASLSSSYAYALSQLLRICISYTIQVDKTSIRASWLTIAMMLNQISMMYSGDRRLLEMGLATGNVITTQCRRNNYLKGHATTDDVTSAMTGDMLNKAWKAWIKKETCCRLGYGSWILQCQLPLHFDLPSSMVIREMARPLPCRDDLWECRNAEEWSNRYLACFTQSTESPPASLAAVLGGLLDGRQVLHHVGNFGRLAIVHAIYQTTFDVRAQTANPLLDGLLGDSRDGDGIVGSVKNVLSNWQARAAVLLEEILSATAAASTATATSAMNGRGMALLQSQHSPSSWRLETSVIASAYHVSLVSIVPVSDLLAFVSSTATTAEKTAAEAELRAWMADNGGRTARRAAVRACITFTLIRERPCHGFYEPVALLMSTLTLWVFNRLSTLLLSSVTNSGTSGNAASSSSAQVTLRLDQAWTAESERAWLEAKNENVRGYLTDVGNIKDAKFRRKLLEVACNALSAMPAWGLSHGFADFLSLLKEAA